MQLVEENKISLNKPIKAYLPDYNDKFGYDIKIHHLLSHTSGLEDFYTTEDLKNGIDFINKMTENEMYKRCQKRLSKPIGSYLYSDANYYLLSLIIEKIRKKDFNIILNEFIFKPLNMSSTGYFGFEKNKIAQLYIRKNNKIVSAEKINRAIGKGATGCYSNTEDLFKFHKGLINNEILTKSSAQKLLMLHTPTQDGEYFGYGWRTHTLNIENKEKWYIEAGGGPSLGVSTIIAKNYSGENFIAILCNTDKTTISNYELVEQIFSILNN